MANRFSKYVAPTENEPQSNNNRFAKYLPQQQPVREESQGRGITGVAKDLGVSAAGGAANVVKAAGDIYGVVTGDYDNAASRAGTAGREYFNERKSPELQALEQARQEKIEAAETELGKAGVALWETIKSPSLWSSFLAEQAPMLLPVGAAGRVTGAAAGRVAANQIAGRAAARGMSEEATERAVNRFAGQSASRAGTAGAVGTGAAMHGSESGSSTYDELLDLPDEIWQENDDLQRLMADGLPFEDAKVALAERYSRQAAFGAGAVSVLTNMLPGARILESRLAGNRLTGSTTGNVVRGFVGETAQEGLEEGTGTVSTNLAVGNVDPDREWQEGVGEAVGMGAAAGPFGAVAGATNRQPQPAPSAIRVQNEPDPEPSEEVDPQPDSTNPDGSIDMITPAEYDPAPDMIEPAPYRPLRAVMNPQEQEAFDLLERERQEQMERDYEAALQQRSEQEITRANEETAKQEIIQRYTREAAPTNPAMANALLGAYIRNTPTAIDTGETEIEASNNEFQQRSNQAAVRPAPSTPDPAVDRTPMDPRIQRLQTIRKEYESAYDRGSLNETLAAVERANAEIDAFAKESFEAGTAPFYRSTAGDMYFSVTPSTRQPGKYQITTFNNTGALGDTVVDSLDEVHKEINGAHADPVPAAEAEQIMARLAKAEAEYQQRRAAFEQSQQAPAAEAAPQPARALSAADQADIERRAVEAERQAKLAKRRRVDTENDTIVRAAIKLGGIKPQWKEDITGDTKGNTNVPGVGFLFTDRGTSIDDMATKLHEAGYIPDSEMQNLGGVPWLNERLGDELAGRGKTYSLSSSKAVDEILAARDEQMEIEREMLASQREAEYAAIEAEYGPEAAELARQYDEDMDNINEDLSSEADYYEQQLQQREETAQARLDESLTDAEAAARDEQLRQADDQESRQPAEAGRRAQAAPEPDQLNLAQQTESERAQAESQTKARQQAEDQKRAQDRAKADADAERDDFRLSGSSAPSDKAASYGQNDMFTATRGSGKPAPKAGTAPEHSANDDYLAGLSPAEMREMVEAFAEADPVNADPDVTNVFAHPKKDEIVRLANKVKVYNEKHGWMTLEEAKERIAEWKDNAQQQGEDRLNYDKVVLSFFDLTGSWSKPWEEAGYQVWRFDIQNDPEMGDVNNFSSEFFGDWFGDFDGNDVYAILAACPCTDFAVSGARHFAAKDADGRTIKSVRLVKQTLAAIEYFKPAVWALENPVGRIEKLGGLPPWRLSFDPNHLGHPYTKKTLLWGRFNGDLPIAPVEPTEGSKMHQKYGGSSMRTKNARSETPEGFAYAFFQANNAVDNPVLAVHGKYDRLDKSAIEGALNAGLTPKQIDELVEDYYYMDLDDDAANQALRDAAKDPVSKAAAEVDTDPTEAQKEAGNYRKGHVSIQGLNISIENPRGSTRSGTDANGKRWENTMAHHYGYLKRTEGADGEQVDVFIGETPDSDKVFIIDQINPDNTFDEHKVMIGFESQADAVAGYKSNYGRGWKVGPVSAITMAEFKAWLADGNNAKPFSNKVIAKNKRPEKPKKAPQPAASQEAVSVSGQQKIEDLGEKIGGARKDVSIPKKPGRTQKSASKGWRGRYRISEIVAGNNTGKFAVFKKAGKGPNRPVGGWNTVFDTQQEAEDMLPVLVVGEKHWAMPARDNDGNQVYEIWRRIGNNKRVKVVDQQFPDRMAAMTYMAANAEQIIETNTTFGEADLPKPDNLKRVGAQRRQGNVDGQDFMDTFGLRGVEFGNWNNQDERQLVMNEAYDGLLDLAEVLGVPAKAIGLNGDLALAFGARGQGLSSARAHYERDKAVINLTKMQGAGALAHEWFHGLDHYFARQDGKASSEWAIDSDGTRTLNARLKSDGDFVSHGFKRSGSGVRPELREAYEKLIRTMFSKAENYVKDTQRADDFVARTREDLAEQLDRLRADLSEQKDPKYWKRKNKPASAEQLAEFDTIAKKFLAGEMLETETRQNTNSRSKWSFRWSNDALDKISEIYKDVRGSTGFDKTKQNGVLDSLRRYMGRYSERLRMLADAQKNPEGVKSVPTDFAMSARELDQGRGEDYWTTPHEMAARAFQGYVEDKIAEQGGRSPFLNYAPENAAIETPWGWKPPYPRGDERKAINKEFDNFVSELRTRETESGIALFSRNPVGASMSAANAKSLVSAIASRFQNAPDVIVVQSIDDQRIPEAVRLEDARQRSRGAVGSPGGAYHQGKAYIILDGVSKLDGETDAQALFRVFAHEVLGHAGLRGLFQEDLKKVLNLVAVKRSDDMKRISKQYGLDRKNQKDRMIAAEEVLAEIAQTNPTNDLVTQAIEAIRQALRKLFSLLPRSVQDSLGNNAFADWITGMSDAEIINRFIVPAREYIRGGQADPAGDAVPAFQRAYHGTPYRFDRFSIDAIGTGEGAQAYGWGLYFAGKREVAEYYRDMVVGNNDDLFDNYDQLPADARAIYDEYSERLEDDPDLANEFREKMEEVGYTFDTDMYGDPVGLRKIGEGNIYESSIPEDSDLLDWDLPLTKQPDSVKGKLQGVPGVSSTDTGRDIYEAIRAGYMGMQHRGEKQASMYLNSLGIPGLRYLDGNSRFSAGGEIIAIWQGDQKNIADKPTGKWFARVRRDSDGSKTSMPLASKAEAQAWADNEINGGSYNYVIWDESRVTVEAVNDELLQAEAAASDDTAAFSRAATMDLPRAERQSEWAQENRRLREQDTALWQKAKTLLRKYFAPGGLLPESVFNEKIARDGKLGVVEITVQDLVRSLEDAIQKDYGLKANRMTENQMRKISDALAGKVTDQIRDNTRTAIVAMRQYMDHLSGQYAQMLWQQVQDMQAQGVNDDVLAAKVDLLNTILTNQGEYVHRSYQVFDDPDWYKNVDESVVDNARQYLIRRYQEANPGARRSDAQARAEVILSDILKNDTAYDSMESFIKESKLGAKDLSILKRRKDIAPEIRALMGEYIDPRINFAKSATKMGRLIFNQKFLDKVREQGMGVFLFDEATRPPGTEQIAADGSEVYAPLNGLYTYKEVAQAMKDALGREQMSGWYKAIVQVNGLIKGGKTILSPTTSARNFQSAMFFSIANGHFDLTQAKKSMSLIKKFDNKQKLAYVQKMKDLGVIYDAPYAEEMMDLLQESQADQFFSNNKTAEAIRASWDFARDVYSFGDDFWKIIGFENEKALLLKHTDMTVEQAEKAAADRIRNTYPTYSMVGKAIQWLRRFPLVGTFVSFPAEIIRTTFNMAKTVRQDWNTPGMRPIAARRALGMSMVAGFAYAAQEIAKAMLDIDDEDEEAIRIQAAPWQKNSNLVITGRDEDGNLRYVDISFLDPYNYFKRPITAMMRDQPFDDAIVSAAADMLSPFLGTDIAAGALMEIYANKTATGGQVFKVHDSVDQQLLDIADHLRKAVQPGIASNLERTWKAMREERTAGGKKYDLVDEGLGWIGWRVSTLDPRTSLYYRSFDFSDAKADATRTLSEVLNDPNQVSDRQIVSAYERSMRMRSEAYRDMITMINSSRRSGLSDQEIAQVLRSSNVSQADARALMSSQIPPWRPTRQSEMGAVRRAEALMGREKAMEIRDRYRRAITISAD